MVAARIARPRKTVSQMTGFIKVRKKLPLIFAVPTTAGTGSETTAGAVITDESTHESTHYKHTVVDLCLIPEYAILDSALTCTLPKNITAVTGMDAFTHAVEAYTNIFCPKAAKKYAFDAVKLIYDNLLKAYEDGQDIEARENMLVGSYYAGAAITNAYVGYVHGIAHGIGGLYGVTHGMANAVILPVVLESYGKAIYKELAELADAIGIKGKNDEEKAVQFIESIKEMNRKMEIPSKLNVVKEKDIDEIIRRAMKEANPAYPVPVIWNAKQFREVIKKL